MKKAAARIVPMARTHISACEEIVALSDPWKRLNERIDFVAGLSHRNNLARSYVCMVGGETAGFILFSPEPVFARGGYLRAIGVSPKFRRQGVGRLLLSYAERMTARRSLNFFLCVSSFNRRAQSFYKRCGYSRAGTLPGLIMKGASEHIYWKRLRPIPSRTG